MTTEPTRSLIEQESLMISRLLRPTVRTIRLDEPVVRLAERLANRYSVTVPQFIEAVLIDRAEREIQGPASPASAPVPRQPVSQDDRVIDLSKARRGRRRRTARRFLEPL